MNAQGKLQRLISTRYSSPVNINRKPQYHHVLAVLRGHTNVMNWSLKITFRSAPKGGCWRKPPVLTRNAASRTGTEEATYVSQYQHATQPTTRQLLPCMFSYVESTSETGSAMSSHFRTSCLRSCGRCSYLIKSKQLPSGWLGLLRSAVYTIDDRLQTVGLLQASAHTL